MSDFEERLIWDAGTKPWKGQKNFIRKKNRNKLSSNGKRKSQLRRDREALSAPIWANAATAAATLAGNQFCTVRSFSQLTNLYHDKEGMMD